MGLAGSAIGPSTARATYTSSRVRRRLDDWCLPEVVPSRKELNRRKKAQHQLTKKVVKFDADLEIIFSEKLF